MCCFPFLFCLFPLKHSHFTTILHKYRFYCTPSHNIKYSIQMHYACSLLLFLFACFKCKMFNCRVSALLGFLEYVPKNISTLVFLIINNLMMSLLTKTLSLASVFWACMNKKHNLNRNNISPILQFLLCFWSNKCSAGEHKRCTYLYS